MPPLKPSCASDGPALNRSFGRETVSADERKSRIRRVFEAVAPRYDLMNDLMSLGIHRLWKRRMARALEGLPGTVVDLAGGTGDIARLLRAPGRRVLVCDPSMPMMRAGRDKRAPANAASPQGPSTPDPGAQDLLWVAGEGEALPFADASVDALTISFGLRNVTRLELALAEIHRVLRPGGRFVCLEFSRPLAWLRPFYDLYSYLVIPRLGAWVAREPIAYQYLVESIRRFPDQRGFAGLLLAAGFREVRWQNLSFGIACLHQGVRGAGAAAGRSSAA